MSGKFEDCVNSMLMLAKAHGLEATRDSWAAAPSVWIEVEKRLKSEQAVIYTSNATANQERIE